MKNYTIDEEKMTTFIKNYQKEKDKIIINYADGNKTEVSNTIENEKQILKIMKNQVINSEKYKTEIETVIKVCKLILKIVVVVCLFGSLAISVPFAKSITDILLVELVTLLFSSPIYLGLGITIREQSGILKDIKKNQLFIKNENLFQTKINENINIPENIKNETKEVLNFINRKKQTENNEILAPNINDIDRIPYDNLKEILDLINSNNTNIDTKKLIRKK